MKTRRRPNRSPIDPVDMTRLVTAIALALAIQITLTGTLSYANCG